ncbi:MAG TPA: hypothetical protein PKD85_13430 [Saprospiraceae bacterium]|nr:hypothetical protein [Saprospiraceae bacterium]
MKYYIVLRVFIIACFLSIISCSTSPNYSPIPELTFVGFDKVSMRQGSVNQDSISLIIDFKDGDGDIGSPSNDNSINLFVIDNRTNQNYDFFRLPAIPEKGANNGVEGRIFINLFSTCCIFSDGAPPCTRRADVPTNLVSLSVFMIDRAGNRSNTVVTSEFSLLCN